jgi:glyoxylase-like metal-dependent hydrolase (beta-lactamase superfamily II)
VEGNYKNVRRVFGVNGKVTQYEAGKDVVAGISTIATPGHTPGHVSHIISSGNASVLVQADVTNVPYLFAHNPGWHVMFDMDGAAAEATRRKIYDRAATDKLLIQGFHYPFPSIAYVEKHASGYRTVAAPWNPVL